MLTTKPTVDQARAWYPACDPVHGFDHVLRVYQLASFLAGIESADLEIIRAAALLHDAQDPSINTLDSQNIPPNDALQAGVQSSPETSRSPVLRRTHHHASASFARRILEETGWAEERINAVEHCIRSHRFRDHSEPPTTLEAQILFDADKLDAIGAIGVARAIAYAARHGQPAFYPPSDSFLNNGVLEAGEPHSAYHEYLFKLRHIKGRLFTPAAKTLAETRHDIMVVYFADLAAEACQGSITISY